MTELFLNLKWVESSGQGPVSVIFLAKGGEGIKFLREKRENKSWLESILKFKKWKKKWK